MPYGTRCHATGARPGGGSRPCSACSRSPASAGICSPSAPDQVATAPATNQPRQRPARAAEHLPQQPRSPRLSLSNDNGVVTVAGTVRDQATRQSILDTMKKTFGDTAVKGDIAVNANATPTPWLANLPAALAQMKTPGVQAVFEDRTISLAGLSDADRDRLTNSLKSLFGAAGMTFARHRPLMSLVSDTNNEATSAAPAGLGSRFQTTDFLNILNRFDHQFPPPAAAERPPISTARFCSRQDRSSNSPSGTVIEISGYTDNTGDPASDLQLSQHRADADEECADPIRRNPAMLVAKRLWQRNPIAGNDTEAGRFENRRISYQISDQNRATTAREIAPIELSCQRLISAGSLRHRHSPASPFSYLVAGRSE